MKKCESQIIYWWLFSCESRLRKWVWLKSNKSNLKIWIDSGIGLFNRVLPFRLTISHLIRNSGMKKLLTHSKPSLPIKIHHLWVTSNHSLLKISVHPVTLPRSLLYLLFRFLVVKEFCYSNPPFDINCQNFMLYFNILKLLPRQTIRIKL